MEREIKFEVLIRHKASGNTFKDTYTLDELLERNGSLFNKGIQEIVYKRQWTGLKDKSGKEIYEGDIIPSLNGTGNSIVSFENGTFTWHGEPLGWDLFTQESPEEIKTETWAIIIGNIYENPELINP